MNDPFEQKSVDDDAQSRNGDRRDKQHEPEIQPKGSSEIDAEHGSKHVQRAMSEVDDAHQPVNHPQAERDQRQYETPSDAIENLEQDERRAAQITSPKAVARQR